MFVLGVLTFIKEDDVTTKKEEGKTPDLEKKGEITFYIGEKLPEVFGQYSSLEVGIGLKIPGDPAKFEGQIDQVLPRIVMKIQSTMNLIAQGSGFKAIWGSQQIAAAAAPALAQPQGQPPAQA